MRDVKGKHSFFRDIRKKGLSFLTNDSTFNSQTNILCPKPGLMKSFFYLLQADLHFSNYKFALLCFITAFTVTLIAIPPIISLIRKYNLYDRPNARKVHALPIPTLGGMAIVAGMMLSLFMWFPFSNTAPQLSFFLGVMVLLALGIFDDLTDCSARYKLMVQFSLAGLVALSGIRITTFEGLFGIHELPEMAQYTVTILTIVGVTNAFNLIDGIDGLAGGLAFMSLTLLGLFLTLSGDGATALIAFALAGGILAFLYFNLNPARIFMGDTGSLVIGFVIAVLCIRLVQVNALIGNPFISHAPVFALSLVFIPVFDTFRVFALRLWKGNSPFVADKTHIHHLLTNQGFSHGFSARLICFVHGFILIEAYWLRNVKAEWLLGMLVVFMILLSFLLTRLKPAKGLRKLAETAS